MFFRAQDGLTKELQKTLIVKLGELTGRPAESGLHIHPILNSERDLGGDDPEISTIRSKQHNQLHKKEDDDGVVRTQWRNETWHSDIAFEPYPADYSSLRLTELPETGGGRCTKILE
jgi:alpha-ketoglutarate-dependent taurine dioxygenase